jgi:ABC-2 type transport system permease protein
MKRVSFSLGRVGLIAAVTLREAARQKLVGLLGLIAMGLVVGVHALRDFNFGASELKFIADFGDGAIAGFGAALTIVLMAQLFFSEIENRTALTLLAKPVWRTEFLLGKFFGVSVVAAVFCALLTATLALVLWNREAALQAERPDLAIAGASRGCSG